MERKEPAWVKTVSLSPPSLKDNTADADRLTDALKSQLNAERIILDLDLLRSLPDLVRKWNYQVRCVLLKNRKHWELIHLTHPRDPAKLLGLAVDLGTSRIVLHLVDLTTGNTLAESSFNNPQLSIGPDILERIHYADQENGLTRLNQLIIESLNQEIEKICDSGNCHASDILLIAAAGNTTMTHLFMGLKPYWIIREPYIPVVNRPDLLKATKLGIEVHPLARTFIFPNVGSYFGGDLIAGILFSGMHKTTQTAMLVDVGTNAEVVLGNANWLIACAGAAGPALEGGVTQMGMMAGPGVIDRFAIAPDTSNFEFHTISGTKPIGICGSGLIDLAAQLFLAGMIDSRGKLVPAMCGSRIKEKTGLPYFVVVPAKDSATGTDLTISQADLDSLVRSKAAMYTILETITTSVGISMHDLKNFYVAGTFGSFIRPESAITIGMLPDLPVASYKGLGNSSIGGATMVLTSAEYLKEVDNIRDQVTYFELNVNQEFMNRFSAAKFLPHTNATLFPSVHVWQNRNRRD
ncbi:MAG: DUF4445 domain-containing protein [Deltaproteobacteria bacterium]|nr:MAG: DUF4445 domain-containing protein [Deltaproteobacteria bacterium]